MICFGQIHCFIYVSIIDNVNFEVPTFGDHVLAFASIPILFNARGCSYITKRCWKSYSENGINTLMTGIAFRILNTIGNQLGVQEHWNLIEGAVIGVVDAIAPLVDIDLSKKSDRKAI